jgi:hypothetical protein
VLHDLQPSLMCTPMYEVGSGHLEDITVHHVQPSYGVSRFHDMLCFSERCMRDLSRGQHVKAPLSMAKVGGRRIYRIGSRRDGIVVRSQLRSESWFLRLRHQYCTIREA